MSNLPIIKQLYTAFRAGNIPEMLQHIREDVDWQYGEPSTNVPWLARSHGHAGVLDYLKTFLSLVEVQIKPKAFLESGQLIVVVLDADLRVRANNRRIPEEDAVHVWTFDDQGKVARFRSRLDTALHRLAYNDLRE